MPSSVFIGNNLRRVRLQQAMSQQELANISGVAQKTITDLENNYRAPQPSTVRKLAKALGVEPKVLVGDLPALQ
jgi:transcriptional regulator with XRE-family HTH domain